MAIRLAKEAGQDMLVTEGEVEIKGLLDDIVILLRRGLSPEELSQNDIDTAKPLEEALNEKNARSPVCLYPAGKVSKGVAYVSAGSHDCRDDKAKIRQFVENYARQEGLPLDNLRETLDVYIFGGYGFYVQTLPIQGGSVRVRYTFSQAKNMKEMLMKELGLRTWPVMMTWADDIAEEIEHIYASNADPSAVGDAPLKPYKHNPPGMKKDLFVRANGSYLYTVKKSPNQPDTSWEMDFNEYESTARSG